MEIQPRQAAAMTATIAPAIKPATPTSHFAMIMSNSREDARACRNDAA